MATFTDDLQHRVQPRIMMRHEALIWLVALIAFLGPCLLIPVARSQRSGIYWERIESLPGDQSIPFVALNELNPAQLMAASTVGGIHSSLDAGHTWTSPLIPPRSEMLGITRIHDLALDPEQPGMAYVAIASPSTRPRPMVFVTENSGVSWHAQGGLGPKRVMAIAYGASTDSLYLATNNDIYRAVVLDQDHWVFVRNSNDLDQALVASLPAHTIVTELAVAPLSTPKPEHMSRKSQVLYIGTENRGLSIFVDPAPDTAVDSDPPRAIWVSAMRDAPSIYVREEATIEAIALDPDRPGVAWVGTHDGIFATMDNGRRWFRLSEELDKRTVQAITYDGAQMRLFAGLADAGVWYSDDLGISWSRLGQGMGRLDCHALAFDAQTETLYAGTNHGLWRLKLGSD